MNRIYRLIWSRRCNAYVAVSEAGPSQGKSHRVDARSTLSALSVAALAVGTSGLISTAWATTALPVNALPTGGQVTAGSANIGSVGSVMTVNQGSQRAAINWQSFNVGSGAAVNFVQPNASAITLNRVVGNERSVIDGAIHANGSVWILNSAGVLFNSSAQVNAGSLVASTLDISDADFMAGKATFEANGNRGSVINFGSLNAADGGYVALLGNQVSNQGTITARLGSAMLAAGDKISLNFNGDSLVGVTIDRGTLNALVENKQAIYADGGLVTLTAKGVDAILRTVVNNTGEIRAQTIENHKGRIFLMGGMAHDRVEVGGTLDASAPTSGDGGFIETSAAKVQLNTGHTVTTLAHQGHTGNWLIDPNDYTIAATGGDITASQLATDLGSSNITIQSSNGASAGHGDVFVNDAVNWSSGTTLTLNAQRNVYINANIGASHAQGKLVLAYGQGAVASGNTADYYIASNAKINLQAGQNFSTVLGSDGSSIDYTVVTSRTDLQAMKNSGNMAGNWALGSDVNLTGYQWIPVGNLATIPFVVMDPFTGRFTGLGHTVSNLGVSSTATVSGMFGYTSGASLRDIHLTNIDIASDNSLAGGLVGNALNSVIVNVSTSGSIQANGSRLGGIAGGAVGTTFNRVTSSAQLYGNLDEVGGLLGYGSNVTIKDSSSSAYVLGAGSHVGGLVGYLASSAPSQSTITNSYYFYGFVQGTTITGYDNVGGLVGTVANGAQINTSYISSEMSAVGTHIGALVGNVASGIVEINRSVYDSSRPNAWLATRGVYGTDSVSTVPSGIIFAPTGNGLDTTSLQQMSTFTLNTLPWNIAYDATLPASAYPVLRWSTNGLSAGSSVWVIGGTPPATAVNYTLSDITSGYTYNGSNYNLSDLWSTSQIFAGCVSCSSWTLGTDYTFQYNAQTVTGFKNAGSYNNIGINILKSGYEVASSGNTLGLFAITPKTLTLSGAIASNKVYDSSATATLSNATLLGVVTGDSVLASTASFANKNVGSSKVVTALLTGTDAANYTLTQPTGLIADITPKTLIVTGLSASNKVYDGNTTATLNGGSLSGVESGDTVSIATGSFADRNVGTAKVVTALLGGADASNYLLTQPSGLTANITPKGLIAAGGAGGPKVYDGTNTASISGASLVGVLSGDTVVLNTGTFADKNVSGFKLVTPQLSGSDATNYSITSAIPMFGSISAKPLTIGGATAATKVYDGTTLASLSGGTLVGAVNGDEVSISSASFADKNVGTAKPVTVLLTGSDLSNYTLTQPVGLTADITPKTLTISGLTGTTKVYDGSLSSNVSGVAVLEGSIAPGTGSATDGKPYTGDLVNLMGSASSGVYDFKDVMLATKVTVHGLSLSGAQVGNYLLLPEVAGTITPKTVALSATKIYDGNAMLTNLGDLTITTGVGSESLSFRTSSATINSANVADNSSNYITNLVLRNDAASGGIASNYQLPELNHNNAPVVINPKALTISGTTVDSKIFDGTTSATVHLGTLSGLLTGELSETLGVAGLATFDSPDIGQRTATVTYTLSDGSGLASNYALANSIHAANITATTPPQSSAPATVVDNAVASVTSPQDAVRAAEVVRLGDGASDRLLPLTLAVVQPGAMTSMTGRGLPGNVVNTPSGIALIFDQGSNLTVLSAPDGKEPDSPVTLSQARALTGAGSNGDQVVRIPASRNSLEQIVNGGVRLPSGVEQQLFVVKQ